MNWAYIAGYFDGEGCISLTKSGKPRVNITNTHLESLKEIQKYMELKINGKTNIYVKHNKNKPCYSLVFSQGRTILGFLNKVKPYSIVKKIKVMNAIKYFDCKYKRKHFISKYKLNKLYCSGLSIKSIALKYRNKYPHVCEMTILRLMREYKIKSRYAGWRGWNERKRLQKQ